MAVRHRTRINPLIIVLLVIGVALLVVGLVFFLEPGHHVRRGLLAIVLAAGCANRGVRPATQDDHLAAFGELDQPVGVLLGDPSRREGVRALPAFVAHPRSQIGIPHEAEDVLGHERRIGTVENDTCDAVLEHVTDSAGRERDDGAAGHLRLDGDTRDPFDVAGQQQDVEASEQLGDVRAVSEGAHALVQPPAVRFALELGPHGAVADDYQVRSLPLCKDAREHVERSFRSLFAAQIPDEAEERNVFTHCELMPEPNGLVFTVDCDEALRTSGVPYQPDRPAVPEMAHLVPELWRQSDNGVHTLRNCPPPSALDGPPRRRRDSLPHRQRAATPTRQRCCTGRGGSVREHDVDGGTREMPTQAPGAIHGGDRTNPTSVRQRRKLGVAPAVRAGPERDQRVVVATFVERRRELECECLRAAPAARSDDVQDPHAFILSWNSSSRSGAARELSPVRAAIAHRHDRVPREGVEQPPSA